MKPKEVISLCKILIKEIRSSEEMFFICVASSSIPAQKRLALVELLATYGTNYIQGFSFPGCFLYHPIEYNPTNKEYNREKIKHLISFIRYKSQEVDFEEWQEKLPTAKKLLYSFERGPLPYYEEINKLNSIIRILID